jgi:hypothetical protein
MDMLQERKVVIGVNLVTMGMRGERKGRGCYPHSY